MMVGLVKKMIKNLNFAAGAYVHLNQKNVRSFVRFFSAPGAFPKTSKF